jgi:hypothetical protein
VNAKARCGGNHGTLRIYFSNRSGGRKTFPSGVRSARKSFGRRCPWVEFHWPGRGWLSQVLSFTSSSRDRTMALAILRDLLCTRIFVAHRDESFRRLSGSLGHDSANTATQLGAVANDQGDDRESAAAHRQFRSGCRRQASRCGHVSRRYGRLRGLRNSASSRSVAFFGATSCGQSLVRLPRRPNIAPAGTAADLRQT